MSLQPSRSTYLATVKWQRHDAEFLANKYSRAHVWAFDGGCEVPASASPHIVPQPWSEQANVDPEEAFIASLASCHMLFFLSIAAARGFQVDSYTDQAEGQMSKNPQGRIAITDAALHPVTEFSGPKIPDKATIEAMHHEAHDRCFIANSVTTNITIVI